MTKEQILNNYIDYVLSVLEQGSNYEGARWGNIPYYYPALVYCNYPTVEFCKNVHQFIPEEYFIGMVIEKRIIIYQNDKEPSIEQLY